MIILPKLENIIFQEPGKKNFVKQLILPETPLSLNIIGKGRSSLVIGDKESRYYLTCNKHDCPQQEEYILLTNGKPTKEKLESKEVVIKKWIKHPKWIAYNPKQVSETWKNDFAFKQEEPQLNVKGLRQPQLGALYKILGHLKLPLEVATVVLPTGTGKTETMLSALIANQCEKLLVTVPSDALRGQIYKKFLTLGLLKEFGIIGQRSLYPIVGIIREGFDSIKELTEFFQKCNVVVTTMSILTGCSDEHQAVIASLCSNVFIDEAHHVKASSWDAFRKKFPNEKVIQFTATPFRNDGKRLDGQIIFNFPLKKAQEQGYFKKIEFLPIRVYDPEEADKRIAEIAVNRLREDIKKGYNHIIMARCSSKERAKKVFSLYQSHVDLNPVLIFSGAPNFKQSYATILKKETRVIVCVDMLGEGFDLPELKIAAFHDIRKSLPITLQFAGRFTRTKYDEELGNASFIANIADLDVKAELIELYAQDADWNQILSDTSYERINQEIEYKNLMDGFSRLNDSSIPFQNIHPKLSTVVFKNKTTEWSPRNFSKGIPGYDKLEHKFFDINWEHKLLVIITARRQEVEWVEAKEIFEIAWDIIVVFWETRNNLLFINSSDNSSLYTELAQAIIGEDAELIRGINVFRSFHELKRIRLQNVGLRQFLGKSIRFRMMVGSDVAEALSIAEKQRGEKAFVMGIGFENGEPVNIGASYKGRIWAKLVGDLQDFKKWCTHLGNKLVRDDIDPNAILRETLIPKQITEIPDTYPVWIDWDLEMYLENESRYKFLLDGYLYDLSNAELCLANPGISKELSFSIVTAEKVATFNLELFENDKGDPPYPDFRIVQTSSGSAEVIYGMKQVSAVKFFHDFIPTIWFADGSALTGNEYVELKQSINKYPREEIIAWDWPGVDLGKEAQGVDPKVKNSIQFNVIQRLKQTDLDIVYDDDYSGEIADIVTLKLLSDRILVDLYHLKFAIKGVVSNEIKNLYEVCGQAQKSVHWKHKEGKEFINHLLRREKKTKKGKTCSRIELGTIQDLEKLLLITKKQIPIEFKIYVVQPGFSKQRASDEILTLLGVTENFIKEVADINFKVISSE